VIQPIHCGKCGAQIEADKEPGGGWVPRGKSFAKRLPDGRMQRGKTMTCVPCIAANPDYEPELGEPFELKTYAERMAEPFK
jgi:polyferredoxin